MKDYASLVGKQVQVNLSRRQGSVRGQLNGQGPEQLTVYVEGAGVVPVHRTRIVDVFEMEFVCSECGSTVNRVHAEGRCTSCAVDFGHASERRQSCDSCGRSDVNVWRDPITRKNEYFCGTCHGKRGRVFQNRWAPRMSEPLAASPRLACEARNVPGTKDCRGEIKPRAGGRVLCNAHAGKQQRRGEG